MTLGGLFDLDHLNEAISINEGKMAEAGFWDNQRKAQKVIDENNELKAKYDTFHQLVEEYEDLEVTLSLISTEDDAELEEEFNETLAKVEKHIQNYKLNLLLNGKYDKNNAIVEIHPGAGGTEAEDWADMLLRMYTRWADQNGFKVEVDDYQPGEVAGLSSVTFTVSGQNAYGYLKSEKGIHRLVRLSPFDLREKFLHADVAMTGANFAVASTGEIVVCTNEGNADMGTSFPKVHIATMGMEKIVPNLEALGVFTRLLARSGTGQPITSYTSHYRRPPEGQEFHIIIVDNGRSDILAKPDHIRTLNCIRCGECMNTCPVYRRSGGYSYTYFIPGPIGINLGMLRNPEEYSDNVSACSLCLSCSNVCPVKIDLGEQIYRWRQDLDKIGKASKEKKVMSFGMKFLMERSGLFNTALKFAPVVNHLPRFMVYNGLNAWGKGRELPAFAKESFNDMWKNNKVR